MALRFRYILLISIALLQASCSTDGCLDNGSAIPLATFYSAETRERISISDIEVRGLGAPNDSVLISSLGSVQEVYLPMRSTSQTTSWRFTYGTGNTAGAVSDILTFEYTSIPYFASEECGASYRYHVTNVGYTTNVITEVELTDSLITNIDISTIHIYFRTANTAVQ